MKAHKLPVHDRVAALRYLETHIRPGLFILQLCHDDFCPAIKSQRDSDCKPPCSPDVYLVEPFADARDN